MPLLAWIAIGGASVVSAWFGAKFFSAPAIQPPSTIGGGSGIGFYDVAVVAVLFFAGAALLKAAKGLF